MEVPAPDFTKGDKIPKKAKHDWNLGATGLRGWIYCDKMVTSVARQIAITKVESNSPAGGIFAVGDVILGVGGKPFSYDPRTEMGKALTLAELEAGQGKLSLSRWRAGSTAEIVVKLPVLGTYSATAPYDCPKSKRILEQGCKVLAKRHFLKINDDFLTNSSPKHYSRFIKMRVLIYKGTSNETNVAKCYGLWIVIVRDAHRIISRNRTSCA